MASVDTGPCFNNFHWNFIATETLYTNVRSENNILHIVQCLIKYITTPEEQLILQTLPRDRRPYIFIDEHQFSVVR